MFIDEIIAKNQYQPMSIVTLSRIKYEIINYIYNITPDINYRNFDVKYDFTASKLYVEFYNLATAIVIHKGEVIPYNHDRYEDDENKYYLVDNKLIIKPKFINRCSEIPKLSKNDLEISILKEKIKNFSFHSSLTDLQGRTANEYYHLTLNQTKEIK
jgi:hypothetical protein